MFSLQRWWQYVGIILIFVISVVPLWRGPADEIIGSGPDVVSTLWGMWWFQNSNAGIFSTTQSTLANHPEGVVGVVLAPSAAIIWSIVEPFVGKPSALRWVASFQVWGLVAGVMAISHRLSQNFWSVLLSGLSLCVGRYLYFSIGEASLVAVAAVPLIWGLFLMLRIEEKFRWIDYPLMLFCIIWVALDNPYLAPILPLALFVQSIFKARQRYGYLLLSAVGVFIVFSIAGLFSAAANPDYPREVAGQWVELFGYRWEIIDLPWARLNWWTIGWPEDVHWTIGVDDARQTSGGRYLGLSVVLFGVMGLIKGRRWRWLCLAFFAYWLALGSVHFGLSGLFLFVNGLLDQLARPLTQPTRFLVVVQLILCIGVGCLVKDLLDGSKFSKYFILALLLADGIFCGGLHLQLPSMALPQLACDLDGPVLLWPDDARDGAQSAAQLLQMSHHQPAPHTAIASWALAGERVYNSLRAAGFREQTSRVNYTKLRQMGYRWVVIEGSPPAWVESHSLFACGDRQVFDLGEPEG